MIVLATNDSPACRRAVERAAELFRDTDVVVATVVPGPRAACEGRGATTVRAAVDEIARAEAVEVLRRSCRLLGPRARARLLTGDAALSLCELARAERADAIVVGSLAGDGVLGAVRGSVAALLTQRAPCSVVELGR